ncbi:hypothetical protein CsSME_00037062 [Camellia sinensis var. sinensis]
MDVDDPGNPEKNSGSVPYSKNVVRTFDLEKSKVKNKLYVGSQALGFRRDHMEVLSPIKDGVVVDWDIVDSIWDHVFSILVLILFSFQFFDALMEVWHAQPATCLDIFCSRWLNFV